MAKIITFEQFVQSSNGKYRDYDGSYGYQCVDLMRFYVEECFGVNAYTAIPTRGNAKDIFNNFKDNKYFKKVKNTPNNVPKKGDIVFWGYPKGFYMDRLIPRWAGHVAIFSEGGVHNFISFDQNFGKPSFCRYVNHNDNYAGVLGWLTPVK